MDEQIARRTVEGRDIVDHDRMWRTISELQRLLDGPEHGELRCPVTAGVERVERVGDQLGQ